MSESSEIRSAAWIGLGAMGFPMAGHLASRLRESGGDVVVYNRTSSRAEAWVERHGFRSASSPSEAARGVDAVFACVGDDPDVREVTLGEDGAFSVMGRGSVFVDHTTGSASLARELFSAASERGFDFVDAPVSGGQAGAEGGILTVMCGGSSSAIERVENAMSSYSRSRRRIGDSGAGQLAKMVNQICIAGLVEGLAEGLHFGVRAGLDMEAVMSAISGGAAGSWQMENRWRTMLDGEFDFGFAVDWMRKDLRICLSEARSLGASLPVASLVDQFYAEVQSAGGGRWDTSSLISRLSGSASRDS